MKICLVIGHDQNSKGAYSKYLKKSEYDYHSEMVQNLHGVDIYRRTPSKSYKAQMLKLAEQINPKGYDLVVELHFNSFNGSANGVETISYPKSKSLIYGKEYCNLISKEYGTKNRGAKEATENGRGWWFLKYMDAPALILEPFFSDHIEAEKFSNTEQYAESICKWFNKIHKL